MKGRWCDSTTAQLTACGELPGKRQAAQWSLWLESLRLRFQASKSSMHGEHRGERELYRKKTPKICKISPRLHALLPSNRAWMEELKESNCTPKNKAQECVWQHTHPATDKVRCPSNRVWRKIENYTTCKEVSFGKETWAAIQIKINQPAKVTQMTQLIQKDAKAPTYSKSQRL